MLSQQKAEGELLQILGRVVSMLLIFALLAVLGFRYFSSVDKIGAQTLKVDQTKLINVLAMVKAQWFAQGRPDWLPLDWHYNGINGENSKQKMDIMLIRMSKGGWPLPNQRDKRGCEQLWIHLLGRDAEQQHIVTDFDGSRDVCKYFGGDSEFLGYSLRSGRVNILTKDRI